MPIEIFSRVKDGSIDRVSHTKNTSNINFKYQKKDFKFVINKLWNNGEKNKEIFDTLYSKSDIHSHVYWLAFGYTGSGKTYTITGMMRLLFEELLKKQKTDLPTLGMKKEPIKVTAYQIYREKIYDMMNNNKLLQTWKTDKLVIKNEVEKELVNVNTMMELIEKNRKMASTNMNNVSSRSHAIINIYYGSKRYTMVDMAGQESGVTSNKNEKLVKKQGTSINLNMLALKECIRMHHDKKPHIPFRRTLLTLALKPLFKKQCYVAFICTISAAQNTFYQLDSIRYASALYDKDGCKKDIKLNEFFKHYTKYVEEIGWVGFKERQIWRKMRFGHYDNFPKIFTYMKQRKSLMQGFTNITKKYEKILPEIEKKKSNKKQHNKGNNKANNKANNKKQNNIFRKKLDNKQIIKEDHLSKPEQNRNVKKLNKINKINIKKFSNLNSNDLNKHTNKNFKISRNIKNPLHILSPLADKECYKIFDKLDHDYTDFDYD